MKILFIRNYGCAIVLILLLNGLNLYAEKNESETIERVFNGLSAAVEVAGEKPKRMRLEDRMLDYKIPGLGVALIEKGKVRWVRYFGFREVGLPSKIDAATRFKVESLSKPLSAFAALRLVDRNLLDLDSPLRNYLKSWTIPSNEFTARSEPTLRQLLSHQRRIQHFWGSDLSSRRARA